MRQEHMFLGSGSTCLTPSICMRSVSDLKLVLTSDPSRLASCRSVNAGGSAAPSAAMERQSAIGESNRRSAASRGSRASAGLIAGLHSADAVSPPRASSRSSCRACRVAPAAARKVPVRRRQPVSDSSCVRQRQQECQETAIQPGFRRAMLEEKLCLAVLQQSAIGCS